MKTKKKAKVKIPAKKVRWQTFEWKAPKKLSKELRELQEREEAQRKLDRTCIRDIMMYFEGLNDAGQLTPFSQPHITALKNVLKKI